MTDFEQTLSQPAFDQTFGSPQGPKGVKGDPGGNVTAIGLFIAAAALAIPLGTDVVRTGGYSAKGWGVADYVNDDTTVTAAYVAANPRTSFISANNRGWRLAWQIVEPPMYGTVGTAANTTVDDSAAFNACINSIITNGFPNSLDGYYGINNAIFVNPGTYGTDLKFALNFGKCNIFCNAAISQSFQFLNCYRAMCTGQLHIRGTGYTSDANTSWTCDTLVFLSNTSNSTMPDIICEGFGYAGVELANNPTQNDTNRWGKCEFVRGGSGCIAVSSRSRAANWTSFGSTGAYGSLAQTWTVNVDALPSAYAQQAGKQVLAKVAGRLRYVTSIDAVNNRISFFPWLTAAEAAAGGQLIYVYGGGKIARGNDSNINHADIIKANGCSCALELSGLYGFNVAILDAESCGAALRLAATPGSTMATANIGLGYCEGNDYNVVSVGLPTGVKIHGRPAVTTAQSSKDVNIAGSVLLTGDIYPTPALSGITFGANTGYHSPLKTNQDVASSAETLDFNQPATFKLPVFRPLNGVQTLVLTSPDPTLRTQMRYDTAIVALVGPGVAGQATSMAVRPTNAAQTITYNNVTSAPGATVTITSLDAISFFSLYCDANSNWTATALSRLIYTPGVAFGYGSGTGVGGTVVQPTNKSTAVTLNKAAGSITMSAAALPAGAKASFVLNNNLILPDDELTVRIKGGNATVDTYKVRSEGNATGSRTITLENTSGGSLSEAVVIGFILQRGTTT